MKSKIGLVILLLSAAAFANQAVTVRCDLGGQKIIIMGLTAPTLVEGSYPGCSVTVFIHNTSTLATIFDDNGNPLSNPITASLTTGYALFAAVNGRYDIQLSGGGMPSPVTITDVLLNDPSSQQTISSFILTNGTCSGSATGFMVICATSSGMQVSINGGSFVSIPVIAGDLCNTALSPQICSTHLTAPLSTAQGGLGIVSTATFPASGTVPIIAGDIGGTQTSPTVISTHLTVPLPTSQGGTGVNSIASIPASGVIPIIANDLGGTQTAPTVVSTHLTAPLPEAQGGIGITSTATFPASGTIDTGTGTANTIPKFTAAAVIGNSAITDNGTTVASSEPVTAPSANLSTSFQLNGSTVQTGIQGTDTHLMSAGTVSGVSQTLCTDANGGATTTGCSSSGVTQINVANTNTVCTTSGASYASCTSTVTWNTPFVNTSYSVNCNGIGATNFPYISSLSKATGSVTVTISNGTSNGAMASTYAELDCIGIHP